MRKKRDIRLNTMQFLVLGFVGIILLGGVLLWLPFCNVKPIAFIDALFTSTSAVCVTGLMTVTPATQFTLIGKCILLLLIQIGGLGVIACITLFLMILRKQISVKERVLIQETYNMNTLTGVVKFVRRIVFGTAIVEGAGAICYAFQFVPEYGWICGLWYSVFHGVSAFCNAGIDILGPDSFISYQGNPLINVTTMSLIILGGLGFIVWFDIGRNIKEKLTQQSKRRGFLRNLSLHTKIVLLFTACLILLGAADFFLSEYSNVHSIANEPLGTKIWASLFHSVTTRTAGFASTPQGKLRPETMFFSCLLMFIGGSPAGTAGGVKTTTIALLLIGSWSNIHGRKDTEAFGRKIPEETLRSGLSILMVSFSFWIGGTILVSAFETTGFIRVLYETTSAIGTVGLTAGLTPVLCLKSKIVIMILMFVGRVGPVTLTLVFGSKIGQNKNLRELPSERILVG